MGIVIAVDVCNLRGHSVSCKMQRKSCKSHVFFFLTETSNAENKITVYLIFTDMPARTHTWSSSLFYSRYITVNFRLKYVWFSGYPTDTPSLPLPYKYFKGFPSSAICPSPVRHGSHFYHSMHVLFSWTQLGPQHEIILLVLMTDVISEGSGEHVCLHNLVRVSLTNKV